VSILAKAKKPAANEQLRVTLRFDSELLNSPFASTGTQNEALRKKLLAWSGSEADLIRYACDLQKLTPEQLAHQGALARAKTLIATHVGETVKKKSDKATHGIAGSADSRLLIARDKLLAEGYKPAQIKATLLRRTADPEVTNHRTAVRFIDTDPILKGAGNMSTTRQAPRRARAAAS
jgi:hypothetical protein